MLTLLALPFLRGPRRTPARRMIRPLTYAFLTAMAGMMAFEALKMAVFPHITIWASHIMTVGVSSVAAVVAGYFVWQMREAEARYHRIFDNAAHGIFQMAPEGRILNANPALARVFGFPSPEEFIQDTNQTPGHFFVDPGRHEEFLRLIGEQGAVSKFESQARRQDGRVIWIVETAQTLRDPDSGQRYFEGTIEDITHVKEMERMRREVEKMKDEFVSVVSHELRTPLTSIRGALGLLASGRVKDPEKAQRMLDIAVTNTDRLIRLINNILDLERMESGRIHMEKQACGVASLMNAAADVMQAAAEKANVKLSVSPLAAQISADPDRIIQTLTNLLSNAIKFSPPGGTIWLTAARVDSRIQFEVRDQGRGIPEDKLEEVFQRFQQVDASDAREKGGTGLGLAICQTIVNQHQGRIWVESKMGEGSSFFIRLPELRVQQEEGEKPEAPAAVALSLKDQKVLVCDDDDSVRAIMQSMLESRGYQVISVGSGQEAIEQAAAQHPGAVLLDIMMPGLDGWQTMAALRQNPATRDIPIIVVSVLPPREVGPSQGDIAAWVRKPLDETVLFQALERTVGSPARAPRVLLVEDDLALARVVMTMFERHRLEVVHARTGREALEASQKTEPDLLILDIGLPEGDGFSVVNWLRQHDRLRLVPLIVYTVRDLDPSDRERLKLGVTEFLTKCRIPPEEFEKRVINLLNQVVPGSGAPVRAVPGDAGAP